jgi:tight adherence protein C
VDPLLIGGAIAVIAAIGALWWAVSGDHSSNVELDVRGVSRDQREISLARPTAERTIEPLFERMGSAVSGMAPSARLKELDKRLARAGMDGTWTVTRVYAWKGMALVAVGVAMFFLFIARPSLLMALLAVGASVLAWFSPNLLISHTADKRRDAIEKEVADTVDQLTVMVRAGLGLDGAMARLVRTSDGPLAAEFARAQQDMRFGVPRDTALANMADRVGTADLRAVISAIAQSERLGVPIAQTLEIQASELREKRRQRAEEQAMKLPVKIIFPTVLCIMPVLFIVILGPAFLRILDTLSL